MTQTTYITLQAKPKDLFRFDGNESEERMQHFAAVTYKNLCRAFKLPDKGVYAFTGVYLAFVFPIDTTEQAEAIRELLGMFTVFEVKWPS